MLTVIYSLTAVQIPANGITIILYCTIFGTIFCIMMLSQIVIYDDSSGHADFQFFILYCTAKIGKIKFPENLVVLETLTCFIVSP